MSRITIDSERCTGHGRCYALVPELFTDDERGHAELVDVEPDAALLAKARMAEANCPEDAIRVED